MAQRFTVAETRFHAVGDRAIFDDEREEHPPRVGIKRVEGDRGTPCNGRLELERVSPESTAIALCIRRSLATSIVQPTLLRALQFGEVRSVGSDRVRWFGARLVAATHGDLMALLGSGELREDLYFRIAALVVRAPPLRERREDIAEMARAFLARSAARMGRTLTFDDSALGRLRELDSPRNVREFENAAERLHMMAEGRDARSARAAYSRARGAAHAIARRP